jgi:putative DNA primase/helicase
MTLSRHVREAIRLDQQRVNEAQIRKHGREVLDAGGSLVPAGGQIRQHDWRSDLFKRGDRYVGDERNVALALRRAPELRELVRLNRFNQAVEFTRSPPWRATVPGDPWTDDDDVALQIWLQEMGVEVHSRATIVATVSLDAKRRPHHPVLGYLSQHRWDGTPRLDTWLNYYLGAVGSPDYLRPVGRAWMISAIARVREPGCQADHVLVLEGPQGAGKSRAARTLAVRTEWFCGDLPDLGNKDALLQLNGKWIIELGELAAIRRAEMERVKSFISQPSDVYRPPYARRAQTIPRQCVFIGTTNEIEYLRDRTGNRRFWPVKVGSVKLDELSRDLNQLWAEAHEAQIIGEPWHLTGEAQALAEAQQAERVQHTELEALVADYLEQQASVGKTEVEIRDVLVYGLRFDPDAPDYVERARRLGAEVSAAMRNAGWKLVARKGRGPRRRRVYQLGRGR